MNTEEILDILSYSIPKSFRTTVLPADKLSSLKAHEFAFVANSQDSDQPGMHWIAMFKQRGKKEVEFFDSCAMPIEFYSSSFESFLTSKANVIRMNRVRIQPGTSNACGQFCIYYLVHRVQGASFERILQTFDEFDLESNDRTVREFITDNFGDTSCTDTKKLFDVKDREVIAIVQCCAILENLLQIYNCSN